MRLGNKYLEHWRFMAILVVMLVFTGFFMAGQNSNNAITGAAVQEIVTTDGNYSGLLGTYDFTKFENNAIVLDFVDHGSFTSEVIDAGKDTSWNWIGWNEGLPYGDALENQGKVLMHFDGNPQLRARDSSGNKNHGVCFRETCPESIEAKFGNAYDFDGNDDAIDITFDNSLNFTDAITIEAWVFIDEFKEYASIAGQPHTSFEEPFTTYGLALHENNNFYFGITTNGERVMCRTSPGSANQSSWIHVVGVWDGIEIITYVNGEISGQPCIKTGDLEVNDMPLFVGYYPFQGSNFLFDGKVDELAIYDKVLSKTEVLEHYKRGVNNINVSVRSCDDNDCDDDEWQAVYTNAAGNKLSVPDNQYFQYKVDFETTDERYSPELYNVTVLFDNLTLEVTEERSLPSIYEEKVNLRDKIGQIKNLRQRVNILKDGKNLRQVVRGDGKLDIELNQSFRIIKDLNEMIKEEDAVNISDADVKENVSASVELFGANLNDSVLFIDVPTSLDENHIEFRTPIVYADNLTVESAQITLPKTGEVETILRCEDFDSEMFTCSNWEEVNISFIDNGDSITFNVTGFSAYGGGIIKITRALHLDENRDFISNIFDEVREKDNVWSEPIYDREYVRVTFEHELTVSNDITVYVRNNLSINTIIEVYHNNSNNKITEFPFINETKYYKVLLTGMQGNHSAFDLRVKGSNTSAFLEFDHIIDPVPTIDEVILNATYNITSVNLTANFINVADGDGDNVKNITDWRVNGTSIAVVNYAFEANSSNGSFTKDFSTYENTGNVTSATFLATSGYDGFGAYEFDGTNDLIELGDISGPISSMATLNMWLKRPDNTPGDAVQSGFGEFGTSGLVSHYPFTDGNIYLETFRDDRVSVGAGNVDRSEWHMLTITNAPGSNNWKVYQNGEEIFNTTGESSVSLPTNAVLGDSTGDRWLHANVSSFQIYNRVLSRHQILLLYANRTDVIHNNETNVANNWTVAVTPHDANSDGATVFSNNLTILSNSPPTIDQVIVNSTNAGSVGDNITSNPVNVDDGEGSDVNNITDWRLNGTSFAVVNYAFEAGGSNGTNTRDYSTYENTGNVSGATFIATAGHDGYGTYSFEADSTEYIEIGDISSAFSDEATLNMWVKLAENTPTLLARAGFGEFGTSGDLSHYPFTDGNIYLETFRDDRVTVGAGNVDRSDWHMLTITNAPGSNNWKVYQNGEEIFNTTGESTISLPSNATIARSSSTRHINGNISSFQIYNRALSRNQILLVYSNRTDIIHNNETQIGENWTTAVTPNDGTEDGITVISNNLTIANGSIAITSVILNSTTGKNVSTDNLTAFFIGVTGGNVKNITDWRLSNGTSQESIAIVNYPFEGGSTSGTPSTNGTTPDYSTGQYNATVVNATFNSAGGYDGFGAYEFNGTNTFIRIVDGQVTNSTFGSISAWVKVDTLVDGAKIVAYGSDTAVLEPLLGLETYNTNGTGYYFAFRQGPFGGSNIVRGNSPLIADNWYHIAVTSNGTGWLLYVNGTEEELIIEGGDNNGNWFNDTLPVQENMTTIGAIWSNGALGDFINATIDEVQIWNRTLSAGQIALLYDHRTDIIHSDETSIEDNWTVCATPTDASDNGAEVCSNSITISSCGQSLTSSTTLTGNLGSSGTCFDIDSQSDIVLDCAGFSLIGNGTGNGINVTDSTNITIINCTVEDFNIDILFDNSNDSTIANLSAFNSTQPAISIDGFNNTFENVTVSDTNDDALLQLEMRIIQ